LSREPSPAPRRLEIPPPDRFVPWNSVWKRFDRLSKACVFEAFFDALAAMSSSAHLIRAMKSAYAALSRLEENPPETISELRSLEANCPPPIFEARRPRSPCNYDDGRPQLVGPLTRGPRLLVEARAEGSRGSLFDFRNVAQAHPGSEVSFKLPGGSCAMRRMRLGSCCWAIQGLCRQG
jgi:hypothetical protein